jgi:hypothetical protein
MIQAAVIDFPRRRDAGSTVWTQAEMQDLLVFYALYARRSGSTASWELGVTESGDPLFYITSAQPDAESVCISRMAGRYVALDECGVLLGDERSLKALVGRLARGVARTPLGSVFVRCFLAMVAIRLTIEEKFEPVFAETAEQLDRFAPGLMALI